MARSSYIYIVREASIVCGCFTVKHEALSAIERFESSNPGRKMTITRVADGRFSGETVLPR